MATSYYAAIVGHITRTYCAMFKWEEGVRTTHLVDFTGLVPWYPTRDVRYMGNSVTHVDVTTSATLSKHEMARAVASTLSGQTLADAVTQVMSEAFERGSGPQLPCPDVSPTDGSITGGTPLLFFNHHQMLPPLPGVIKSRGLLHDAFGTVSVHARASPADALRVVLCVPRAEAARVHSGEWAAALHDI